MIHVGDCLEVMRTLEANSFDSIVTDPPYHLTTGKKGGTGPATLNPNSPAGRSRIGTGFMGKAWDGGDIAFRPETWAEALRVAKPGAYLAAFGGTRTFHRLACAIEDAGWELRDTLMWLYGSGFPKSHNGEWGGTALKPAWEPIILARKPLIGTVEANWREHGTGALNIDGCRVETDEVGVPREKDPARMTMPDWRMSGGSTGSGASNPLGRWPANLIHDGSEEVLACFPDAPGQVAKASTSTSTRKNQNTYGSLARGSGGNEPRDDAGSAARFFAEHQLSDDDWLWSHLSLASIAGSSFCLQSEPVASALSRAATEALPVGSRCVVSTAPSTNVTASELRQIATALIGTIQRTASECWHGQRPGKPIQTGSLARVAVAHEPIGITTITVSHWKSDGSAAPVTFSITETNSEPGAKDSAGRFRYCPKASREDRNAGCEGMPLRNGLKVDPTSAMARDGRGDGIMHNHHPTVKPTVLMRWLCRLVTPRGGLVLDPFAGSGSTGRGAIAEGMRFTGIELDPDYAAIAEARIRAVQPGLGL